MMRRIFLITIFFLAASFSLPFFAHALTLSPPRMEVTADSGQTYESTMELFNETQDAQTFYSSTANFEARGESGTPYFLPDRTGLATWISVPDSVSLKPSETKKISFSIHVPRSTEPGGYFAAIFWGTSPPNNAQTGGQQVSVSGKIGMLVLLSVSGGTKTGAGLVNFGTDGGLLTGLPVTLFYRFSNDGSDLVHPVGSLEVKNIFGATIATLDANSHIGNVLPHSTRKFSMIWLKRGQTTADIVPQEFSSAGGGISGFFSSAGNEAGNFALGLYSADLSLHYGKDNKATSATYHFFVFPWQLLSIVVFILAIIVFGLRIALKKYNRWIIAKASQHR